MTASDTPTRTAPTGAERPPSRPTAPRRGVRRLTRGDLPLAALVALVAAVARLTATGPAYDLYVDEFTYALLGRSVWDGHLPPVSGDGLFVIHPPVFFLWAAPWVRDSPDAIADVLLLRYVQQILAVACAVLLFAIARRAAGRWAGLVAGLLFAVDPFVLRQNGRILLETTTMTPVLVGYALLARHLATGARSRWLPAVAGLCFGVGVATKDMALFVTVLPLAVLAVTGWALPRRQALTAIAASAVPYTAYLVWITAHGWFGTWWTAKSDGFDRLIGLTVSTGYNSGSGPGLLDVAGPLLSQFGISFAIMGLGGIAGVLLLLPPAWPLDRVLGLFAVCGCATVAYGTLFGTSEEHLFYFAMVPAIPAVAVGAVRLARAARRRGRRLAAASLVVLGAAVGVVQAGWWVHTRSTPDDAQVQAFQWLEDHAPRGSRVYWVAGQTEFALSGRGYELSRLGDAPSADRVGPGYLVVHEKEVDQGYSDVTPGDVRAVTARSTLLFSEGGASYGEISVYRVPRPRS